MTFYHRRASRGEWTRSLFEEQKSSNPIYVSNGSISLSAIRNPKIAAKVPGKMSRPAAGRRAAYSGVKGNQ